MRVAVFNGAGKPITIEDVADDPLGPNDLRIEVGRCGICGSDISMTSGSPFDYATGVRLGHEIAGTVIELGSAVTRFKLGDTVAVFPNGFCGQCDMCRGGRPLFCAQGRMQFGGFGERMAIVESSAFPFPTSVSMAEGALVEPIACGRRALQKAHLEQGEDVLVLGGGSMGMAAIWWARRMGAGRIVAATRSAARHETLRAIGADACVTVSDEDPDAITRAFAAPPRIAVESIGKPGQLHFATQHVGLGGAVISLGMCTACDPVVPAFNAFRDVTIHFPVSYTEEDWIETIRSFDADEVPAETMVSETVPLSALPALIEEMRGAHSHQKVQIVPNEGCAHG
jgi:threonine dehydrogenase-like Zn-dependent dehydrogenase